MLRWTPDALARCKLAVDDQDEKRSQYGHKKARQVKSGYFAETKPCADESADTCADDS